MNPATVTAAATSPKTSSKAIMLSSRRFTSLSVYYSIRKVSDVQGFQTSNEGAAAKPRGSTENAAQPSRTTTSPTLSERPR